jgi:hypothetical protein
MCLIEVAVGVQAEAVLEGDAADQKVLAGVEEFRIDELQSREDTATLQPAEGHDPLDVEIQSASGTEHVVGGYTALDCLADTGEPRRQPGREFVLDAIRLQDVDHHDGLASVRALFQMDIDGDELG